MAFDFKKVLDFLNPTYAQLKSLLIFSVSSIGMVWFISAKTTEFRTQTKETNQVVKESVQEIKDIKSTMATKVDIDKVYNEMMDMNSRNNSYLNSKFSLLLNYGTSNKGLLKDMMQSLDEQQRLYEQDRLKNIEYWKSIQPPLIKSDTNDTKIVIKKIDNK